MSKTKVAIITSEFPPEPGGIGNHAYNLAINLVRKKYIISVLTDQRLYDNFIENNFDDKLPFNVHRVKLNRNRIKMYLNRFILSFSPFRSVTASAVLVRWLFFCVRPRSCMICTRVLRLAWRRI